MCSKGNPQVAEEDRYTGNNQKEIQLPYYVVLYTVNLSCVFCWAVQWSCDENFIVLAGEREIYDMKHLECHISDLTQGCRYYFRVACGNLKGYGNYRLSSPASVIPSSKCCYHRTILYWRY